jgi:hypothetical protein
VTSVSAEEASPALLLWLEPYEPKSEGVLALRGGLSAESVVHSREPGDVSRIGFGKEPPIQTGFVHIFAEWEVRASLQLIVGSRGPLTWPSGFNPAYLRKEMCKVRDDDLHASQLLSNDISP